MFVSFHSFGVCLPLQTIISKVNLAQRFSVALKLTLKYHYVTALITLLELRPRELSPQLYHNANDSCWSMHKNEVWLAEKVQSFRDFTEYYFTSRLNKTPKSALRYDHSFLFFNFFFYIRSLCRLVHLLSKHLSAQTFPNVRTQFRKGFLCKGEWKVRFKRWHIDRGSLCHITLYKAMLWDLSCERVAREWPSLLWQRYLNLFMEY